MQLSSRILRMGLVNSGMFNQLTLNLDVPAIHFIAANNVGKTSLIEAVQFLYFHSLKEMTFSKSLAETLPFYFRPEGSYLLFEVRTLAQTVRTICVYGEGSADTRRIYLFDGSFDLSTFMDDEQKPLRPEAVQPTLFARRFTRFATFEEYERALIGQHADDRLNVQLFDLSLTNFRLFRELLRGLLRLDRLGSRDVRDFLIRIIETGAVKTQIDIARDFEGRYADIRGIQRRLTDLEALRPIIQAWQERKARVAQLEQRIVRNRAAQHQAWQRLIGYLSEQQRDYRAQYQATDTERTQLEAQRDDLIQQRSYQERLSAEHKARLQEWQRLATACAQLDPQHLRANRDQLLRQRIKLDDLLANGTRLNIEMLKRRQRQIQRELDSVQRQLHTQTVSSIWQAERFSEDERAVLRFLFSQQLLGLDAALVHDRAAFLTLSREIVSHVTADGTLRVGGLIIPRNEWFTPSEDVELPQAKQARLKIDRAQIDEQLRVAHDRQQVEQERRRVQTEIETVDGQLRQLEQFAQLKTQHGNHQVIQTQLESTQAALKTIADQLSKLEGERTSLRQRRESQHYQLREIEQTLRRLKQDAVIGGDSAEPDETVAATPELELADLYERLKERVRRNHADLRRERDELKKPQDALEAHYDRESADVPFERWLERKLNVASEIDRVRALLQESYNNLITQVRRELGNLLDAWQRVEERVAALNNIVRRVSISNIERVTIQLIESDLVGAIRQTAQVQPGLFDARPRLSAAEGSQFIDDYLSQLRSYGQQVKLADLFDLAFDIEFIHNKKPTRQFEINQFESNGTRIAVKIVIYLGLIRLLQGSRARTGSRIPFFLDEVGSIDSRNLSQLLTYCADNNFLPIFASPTIRPDIPHSYLFRRDGSRSFLANEIIMTASA